MLNLFLLAALSWQLPFAAATAVVASGNTKVFEYNICNGLSEQLLIHASAIAKAIQEKATVVHVPDYFIVQKKGPLDMLPLTENSVPFATAFDITFFQQRLQSLGIEMKLIRWKHDDPSTTIPACAGLSWLVNGVDSQVTLQILKAFRPSPFFQNLTQSMLIRLPDTDKGVCFHYRHDPDWHDHCRKWSAQQAVDGVYRGNCESISRGTVQRFNNPRNRLMELHNPRKGLMELLQHRALHKRDRWIYYYTGYSDGKTPVPVLHLKRTESIFHQNDLLMNPEDEEAVQALKPNAPIPGLWALLDFFVCDSLSYLVGNSVSLLSALLIARQEQEQGAYWYNSQSIPLGEVLNVYQVPIVYTYTELSDANGKYMLQASIASLRQHMPQNKVYILYHGDQDKPFRQWLQDRRVTIFEHHPKWQDQIELMRQNGNATSSHLFLHSGNYLGTWQRIDVPNFVDAEYVLLLDADTVILQPFTLNDFGLNLTTSIGMSAESDQFHVGNQYLNAGVTLMNVPKLRATYDEFLEFVLRHVDSGGMFIRSGPSDQGAYMEFYEQSVQLMAGHWNWKPYWNITTNTNRFDDQTKILHFHGMKPHDYVRRVLGETCDSAIQFICEMYKQPMIRVAMENFLRVAATIPNFYSNYCSSSFHTTEKQRDCVSVLDQLVGHEAHVSRQEPFNNGFLRMSNESSRQEPSNNGFLRMFNEEPESKPRDDERFVRLQFQVWALSGYIVLFSLYIFLRQRQTGLLILVFGALAVAFYLLGQAV